MAVRDFWLKIKRIVFPSGYKCIFCHDEINNNIGVCDKCMLSLPFVNGKVCEVCGKRVFADSIICDECKSKLPDFDRAFSVFWYKNEIAAKVRGLKFGGRKYYGEVLSRLMLDRFKESGIDVDIILPLPLHPNRLKKRGYNQAEVLLTAFVKEGLPVDNSVLKRVKDTKMQAKLNREQRQENIVDAFKVVDRQKVKGKNVLIVDDVMTSGFTCSECSRLLKEAGANKVYAFTLARADN